MDIQDFSYEAVILDLDGVVTQTAHLHAQAWKQMFDDYLAYRSRQEADPQHQVLFDIETDYRNYVDGKPRYDGVQSFLLSRGIELSYGHFDDPPGTETMCGLGNRKNQLFLDLLKRKGVDVYGDTIRQIRRWREQGVKTAIISSSRNCAAVLDAAGATSLFDTKVDGLDSERLHLNGKPAPDIFLQAARQLAVDPKLAIVFEDALAGVEAGQAGHFGLVVGVDREGQNESLLRQHGADLVVRDLDGFDAILQSRSGSDPEASAPLPSALEHFNHIATRIQHRHLALFLDYDGTLTPIVPRPEDALLSAEMRSLLHQLANRTPVAVVSGRDLADVRKQVDLDSLHYAGSHGFDILTAEGHSMHLDQAQSSLVDLDEAEDWLRDDLKSIDGARVERKHFAIAVHYREVSESDMPQLETLVDRIVEHHPQLRQRSGKKIVELQPNVDWDKGRAVLWLLDQLQLDRPDVVPLYIGDDTTDEDAFRALQGRGISIRVGEPEETTRANYGLRDPEEVRHFFQLLVQQIQI